MTMPRHDALVPTSSRIAFTLLAAAALAACGRGEEPPPPDAVPPRTDPAGKMETQSPQPRPPRLAAARTHTFGSYAVDLPEDWCPRSRGIAAAFLAAPQDRDDVGIVIEEIRPSRPSTLDACAAIVCAQWLKRIGAQRVDEQQDLRIGSWEARRYAVRGDERTLIAYFVRFGPSRYVSLTARCPTSDSAQWRPAFDRIAASLRWHEPPPTADDVRALERFRAWLESWRASDGGPAPVRDEEFSVVVGGQSAGTFRIRLEPRDLEGLRGVAFYLEGRIESASMAESDGHALRMVASGMFSRDGAIQRERIETEVASPDGSVEKWSSDAELRGTRVRIERVLYGGAETVEFDVPAGTLLAGTEFALRPWLAIRGEDRYALRVLYIGENCPTLLRLRVWPPDEGEFRFADGQRRRMQFRTVESVRAGDAGARPDVSYFRPDGSPLRILWGSPRCEIVARPP
jgi:hypothetical protein